MKQSVSHHQSVTNRSAFGHKSNHANPRIAAGIMLACIAYFIFDITVDVAEHIIEGASYTTSALFHTSVELVAVIVLGYSVHILRQHMLGLRQQLQYDAQTMQLLRGEFDRVIHAKFDEWKLSSAERDVTLLIIKGLSITDIAAARGTASGTVKAQSTAIFRKIGVSSKAELMSLFMDEFLERATNDRMGA